MPQAATVTAALVAAMQASAALQSLIGTSPMRIFEVAAPPDLQQYPCLSFAFVGGSAQELLSPTSKAVPRQRFEVNGLALSYSIAAQIRAEAILALKAAAAQICADGSGLLAVNLLNPGTDLVSEDRVFRCLAEFYVFSTLPSS